MNLMWVIMAQARSRQKITLPSFYKKIGDGSAPAPDKKQALEDDKTPAGWAKLSAHYLKLSANYPKKDAHHEYYRDLSLICDPKLKVIPAKKSWKQIFQAALTHASFRSELDQVINMMNSFLADFRSNKLPENAYYQSLLIKENHTQFVDMVFNAEEGLVFLHGARFFQAPKFTGYRKPGNGLLNPMRKQP